VLASSEPPDPAACGGGKSSKNYAVIPRRMAFQGACPACTSCWPSGRCDRHLCALTRSTSAPKVAANCFDSGQGQLSPLDTNVLAAPYRNVVNLGEGQPTPTPPDSLYLWAVPGCLERMLTPGSEFHSLIGPVEYGPIGLARLRKHLGVAGHVDPGLLFGHPRGDPGPVVDTCSKARGRRHILKPRPRHPAAPRKRSPGCSLKPAKR